MICDFCGADPLAIVSGTWEMELPIGSPSQNAMSGNKGSMAARAAYRKLRDNYCLFIRTFARQLSIPHATARRRIRFVRYYMGRSQPYDLANLIGGAKALVDALVLEGQLLDDDEKHFEGHYAQRRVEKPSKARLVLIIEELRPHAYLAPLGVACDHRGGDRYNCDECRIKENP
jgi:hypothetical protein